MKRALLLAGGTVGGLGAVLSITPPQLGSQGMANLASSVNGAESTMASAASSPSAKAVVPQATSGVVSASASSATPKATPKATVKKSTATKKSTASATANSQTTTPVAQTPAPVLSKSAAPTPTVNNVNGTFAGSSVFVNYGTVQVEITVVNGKITDARALQAPTGRSDRFTQYAVPLLRQQTLAAQSANIQGASGASYTSYGWYTSLQVALSKAGL
jgi:uncharacterized protein with FMN-binding domain